MSTKLTGGIAEQAAILQALKRGWGVLKPFGDRLPYDLVFDVNGVLAKIQVKHAGFDEGRGNYVVDNRRTKTNRRAMVREVYQPSDFDFALAYVPDLDVFYVLPVECSSAMPAKFIWWKLGGVSENRVLHAIATLWTLILQWAAHRETDARSPVKVGEAVGVVIPSQALRAVSLEGKV